MKKLSFLLLFALISPTLLLAQNDSLRIKMLSDSIANLYERYLSLEGAVDANSKSKITKIEDKIKVLENQAQGNTEQLSKISDEDRRTLKTIYENNKLSIVATANYMDAVNDGLNALEFTVSSLDYSNSIFELNNPTNTDLGFSLDKAMLKIVDDKILNSKFGKKFGSKFKTIISSIINNPIINNPITKAIVSTVPAVSSISSVFNMVNTVAIENEDIGAEALKEFNKEIQKYVAHYEALAKASRDLDFNLSSLKLKTESVRKLTNNFVRQSVTDLYTPDGAPDMSKIDMNVIIKQYYNYAKVTEYIMKLEQLNNNNYNYLSKRLVFPVVGRSKVAFIGEEIEKLYSEYQTTLNTYHENVKVILNNATTLSDDKAKITQKVNDLDTRYTRLIESYVRNVNIANIKALEDNIPRY
ncbi:MAG: hypothetical protein NW226_15055 [Microscillaceae bacterium]|nr:hypothetical protein [Microscillaceae bacterium]